MVVDPSHIDLTGQRAVITGAAMGLGQAIALSFARFGADLALCDRDATGLEATAALVRKDGRQVETGVFDVRDAEAVEGFIAQITEGGRAIDILVNNAGGTFQKTFGETSLRAQQALVDENFSSVTHFVRAALPHLRSAPADAVKETGASIINITSIEGHRAGPGFAIYSAMKAAVENFSKSLSLELGARNIRVNCIAPDLIPTPGIGDFDANTPLARKGHPDDVAGAALYLASNLSRFVTGTTLHVDGGSAAAGGWKRNDEGGFEV